MNIKSDQDLHLVTDSGASCDFRIVIMLTHHVTLFRNLRVLYTTVRADFIHTPEIRPYC